MLTDREWARFLLTARALQERRVQLQAHAEIVAAHAPEAPGFSAALALLQRAWAQHQTLETLCAQLIPAGETPPSVPPLSAEERLAIRARIFDACAGPGNWWEIPVPAPQEER